MYNVYLQWQDHKRGACNDWGLSSRKINDVFRPSGGLFVSFSCFVKSFKPFQNGDLLLSFTWACHLSISGGSCHKYHFCHDKSLLQQTWVCHDKTRLLLWQKYACLDNIFGGKHNFVATIVLFCFSWKTTSTWQKYVYCDKRFVTTSILLSRQTCVCCNKTFVTTKIYLWQLPLVIFKCIVTAASVRFCCTVVADLFENHCEVTLGGWQDIKIQMLMT